MTLRDSASVQEIEADHVQPIRISGSTPITAGGDKRRPRALRVLSPEPTWLPRAGLPVGGRDECRHGERPCPYVRCKWHLWLVEGRDRPGRRWNGRELPTTLEPRWLEYPTPACCALDIAEAVPSGELLTYARIGEALNFTLEWSRQLVFRAITKLRTMERP